VRREDRAAAGRRDRAPVLFWMAPGGVSHDLLVRSRCGFFAEAVMPRFR